MNILASYNWLKEYIDTDLSPADFASELSLKSMTVEYSENMVQKFDKMVVGLVNEMKEHPNADKLKIAITDIGGEEVEIVCGGRNLEKGMRVFVALPGAKVRWHGEGELIELKEAKIRGQNSYGMICAPAEVGFEKISCGPADIWDLSSLTSAKPGTSITKALGIDDTIFDVEITTNRSECMGMIGLAREGAAAIKADFHFEQPKLPEGKIVKPVKVKVEDPELCPRYMAVVIDGVKIGPSPLWLQTKLLLAGHRPINNIVDISNYVLHEYGQPMHAFDYEKLEDNTIIVRRANKGEIITALDENEYELSKNNLIIADSKNPVAVAGVMGGKDSGTWEGTTTVVFEAASFNEVSVRKTSRELNLYSDSQLLFEKGLSTEAPEFALARAIELTLEIAGGEVASDIVDVRANEYEPIVYPFRPEKVRKLLGVEIEDEEQIDILESLGFLVQKDDDSYLVTVPYWRDHDIEDEVDFAEEVARMYGYHNIKGILPDSAPPSYVGDRDLEWEMWTKKLLAASGFTELYGLSFISENDMKKYGQDSRDAARVLNPLSSDLTHMRTSLMPSLLRDIENNQGQVPGGRVFELSRVYIPNKGDLPTERTDLVVAEFGVLQAEESFARIKGVIEELTRKSGLTLKIERLDNSRDWHSSRSASIIVDGEHIGVIGQVAQSHLDAYGISRPVIAAQFNFWAVVEKMKYVKRYEEVPELPAISRDISILVDLKTTFEDLEKTVSQQSGIIENVSLVEVYQGAGIPEGKKSVTLSVTMRSSEKTLSSEHAEDVMKTIGLSLERKFNAVLR